MGPVGSEEAILGDSFLNFFLGLSEGIGGAGAEMVVIFHKGTVWFCVAWVVVYCTLGAWMKSSLIGRGRFFVVNVLFSFIFVNPWTLGNVAFYAVQIFSSPEPFLLMWVLYFWILPMLFDAMLFKALPRWGPFRRFSREWPNPRAFIVSTLAVLIAFIPAFMAFTAGLSNALILPK